VFANRKWMQAALFLNLLGTVALFYSFQATSSNFRLVTQKTHSALAGEQERSALCVYGHSLVTGGSSGEFWSIGGGACPDWEHAKAAAVVNIEHPMLVGLGFLMIAAGFVLQYLAIPQPQTIAQIRSELKAAKLKETRVKHG
jgi:hypothetical protein